MFFKLLKCRNSFMLYIKPLNYKPIKYFILTFLFSWIFWVTGAYLSYYKDEYSTYVLFLLFGLGVPFTISLLFILSSNDQSTIFLFLKKLFDFRMIKLSTLPKLFLIMPATMFFSILISLLFGESTEQFQFSEGFSFSARFFSIVILLLLAAAFEEIGWRSYAMDSLLVNRNYFKATLIFGLLWSLWHLPLFFVKDYYHYDLVQENLLFAVNFLISVIPLAFILSWVFKENNSSILAAIIFHFFINVTQEAFKVTQITKMIETIILIILAAIIVFQNQEMFFGLPKTPLNEDE